MMRRQMTTSSIFFFLIREVFLCTENLITKSADNTHAHTDTHLCENKASKSDHKNARVHFFSLLVVLL